MLYIRVKDFIPVEATASPPKKIWSDPANWAVNAAGEYTGTGWLNRHDIRSLQFAQTLADLLTEQTGKKYLGCTSNGSGDFCVIEAPCIGDPVSKYFNGDSYPCGVIERITPTWQITTSTGAKFRRPNPTAAGWRAVGGTWSMFAGHVDERAKEI